MKYMMKSFTCPAVNKGVSDQYWDRIFMDEDKFIEKYGQSKLDLPRDDSK